LLLYIIAKSFLIHVKGNDSGLACTYYHLVLSLYSSL